MAFMQPDKALPSVAVPFRNDSLSFNLPFMMPGHLPFEPSPWQIEMEILELHGHTWYVSCVSREMPTW